MESDLILKILNIQSSNRTFRQQSIIQNHFSQYHYFQKICKTKKTFNQICNLIYPKKMKIGQTVFFKGDWPSDFYIIIKGEVNVLITKDNETINKQKDKYKSMAKLIDNQIKQLQAKKQFVKGFENMNRQQRKLSFIGSQQQQRAKFQEIMKIDSFGSEEDNDESDDISQNDYVSENEQDNNEMEPQQNILFFNQTNQQSPSKINQFVNLTPHQNRISVVFNYIMNQFQSKKLQNCDKKIEEIDIFETKIPELNNLITIGDLDYPEKYYQDGIFKYQLINILDQQMTFGENGLLLKQSRSATIVCVRECQFGLISKENYNRVLLELTQQKIYKKAMLIQQSLSFEAPINHLIQLANCFHKLKPPINAFLFIENEKPKEVFVIKKGDVQIVKISKQYKNNLCNQSENMQKTKKQQQGSIQPLIKLSMISNGNMIGHLDLLLNRKRQYSAQIVSANATLYYTDKYQFRQQINDIAFSKTKIILQARIFNDTLHQNYAKFEQIQYEQQNYESEEQQNKMNKSVTRIQVQEIEDYLMKNDDIEDPNEPIRHKIKQNYGGNVIQKLKKMTELISQYPQNTEIDNDAYLRTFDKAGLEKKMKKVKLRKRILAKGQKFGQLEDEIKQKIMYEQSTYAKIQQQKQRETGEWKRQLIKQKSLINNSELQKVYKSIENLNMEHCVNTIQEQSKQSEILKSILRIDYGDNQIKQQNFRPKTAKQRPVTNETNVSDYQSNKNTRPKTPLYAYTIGNYKNSKKYQIKELKRCNTTIISTKHSMFRLKSPESIQQNLIKKRFRLNKTQF